MKKKENSIKNIERENFRKMTLKEKVAHIRYYYTPHILLTLLSVAFLFVMSNQLWSLNSKKTYAKLSFYDCPYNDEQGLALIAELNASGLYDFEKYETTMQNFLYDTQLIGNPVSRKFFSEVAAGTLDIIIISMDKFNDMVEGGYCRDLSDLAISEEYMLYDKNNLPRGVSLEKSPHFAELPDKYAAIVFLNSKRIANAYEVVQFIIQK